MFAVLNILLLARSLASVVCRRRLSSFVRLPAGGPASGRVGGRTADTARRASTVTSRC